MFPPPVWYIRSANRPDYVASEDGMIFKGCRGIIQGRFTYSPGNFVDGLCKDRIRLIEEIRTWDLSSRRQEYQPLGQRDVVSLAKFRWIWFLQKQHLPAIRSLVRLLEKLMTTWDWLSPMVQCVGMVSECDWLPWHSMWRVWYCGYEWGRRDDVTLLGPAGGGGDGPEGRHSSWLYPIWPLSPCLHLQKKFSIIRPST